VSESPKKDFYPCQPKNMGMKTQAGAFPCFSGSEQLRDADFLSRGMTKLLYAISAEDSLLRDLVRLIADLLFMKADL